MISPRSSHGMVYHDGYVYVVGGNTYGGIDYGEVATPTCERFCVSFKKKWTPVAELNCPAKEPCVVAYKQNILKFGGKQDGDKPSEVIEIYSPDQNIWMVVPYKFRLDLDKQLFREFYNGSGVQIKENQIFVFGGRGFEKMDLVQSFVLEIGEEDQHEIYFRIKDVNRNPLMKAGQFSTTQSIVYNNSIFGLSDNMVERKDGKGEGKQMIGFCEQKWYNLFY